MAVINTNILSMSTQNNLNKSQSALGTAIERLSSGLRINSAKDDAAGQAISNRFSANIQGLNQAARNANDGISIAQTTEGSLNEINNNLQRIRQLAVQSANGSNSDSDKKSIQSEITSRLAEIDRVSAQTQFNGINVLASNSKMTVQVGANDGETIDINLQKTNASTLGLGGFSVSSTNTLKTSDAITQVGSTTAGMISVNLSAAATSLTTATGTTVTANSLTFRNVQDAAGASTNKYVVTTGNGDNYAASIDSSTGAVKLNTADVSYTDPKNGITSAVTLSAQLVKVSSNAAGAPAGYVTVQGQNIQASANALDNSTSTSGDRLTAAGDISTGTANVKTFVGAPTADPLKAIDAAIAKVDTFRSDLGAIQNRLTSAITNLTNTSTNLSSAQSRIQDADYATEVSNMSRAQILQQAGTSVLSQANQVPQSVLSLLR